MDEREKAYHQTNDETVALLKLMAEEKDPAKIRALDRQCAVKKIQELRGKIKTI